MSSLQEEASQPKQKKHNRIVEIKRTGEGTVFRYEMRTDGGWLTSVVIDDVNGDILVCFDTRYFFGHWWGRRSEHYPKLRDFLVDVNTGYINDKFSYGLERWCGDEAEKDLREKCEEKFGHPDDWPYEIIELLEDSGLSDMSKDGFYAHLNGCDKFTENFHFDEYPSGELGANKMVMRFTDFFWEDLQEHWRKELKAGI